MSLIQSGSLMSSPSGEASASNSGIHVSESIKQKYKTDPAFGAPGTPPNYGEFVLPQVMTLQGLVSNVSKVYRMSDEALKHSLEDARFMELDVGIQECVQARTRSVALLNWHLEPDDATSQEQNDLCEELTKILKRCPRFMQVRESLMGAAWYGRSAVSFRYGWSQFGSQMRIAPLQWKPVHGDKLVFRLDDGRFDVDPNQVGIRVGMTYLNSERISDHWDIEQTDRGLAYFLSPYERRLLAIHKHQMQDGAYEEPQDAGRIHGTGIRSQIYWEWFQKQETLRWLMEYLERSAFGINLWYFPASNPGAKAQMEQAVKAQINTFRNNIFVPRAVGSDGNSDMGFGMQHIETGMAGVQPIMDMLNQYFGHRIKRLILGQTLTSESEGGGLGSDGIARVHLGTFKDIIRYDATNLEETITEDIVTPIKQWNFRKAGHFNVRFVIETEEVEADEKIGQAKQLWDMGAQLSERELLEAIGMKEPEANDRVLQNPQLAQAAAGGMPGGQPGQPGGMQAPQGPKTAIGKQMNDAMRHHGQHQAIADAGQRTIMGDHFDETMHKHAIAGKLSEAMQGA